METSLVEIKDDADVIQDLETEELAYLRFRTKQMNTFVVALLSVFLCAFVFATISLAGRPPRVIYVRTNELHQSEVITDSATRLTVLPDDVKHYLNEWVEYRYNRQKTTVATAYADSYLYLEDTTLGPRVQQEDAKKHTIANVIAGKEAETTVQIKDTSVTSLGWQQFGSQRLQAGTAQVVFVQYFANTMQPPVTYVIPIRFVINPEQVAAQKLKDPVYAKVNPLGITIIDFVENVAGTSLAQPQ